ncbi:MAG TPA: alpha/beta fold hydrolase [Actinomycetota bacterium]|nr:alpha/beta fold hydrolase [Actinomycetota bacterium]
MEAVRFGTEDGVSLEGELRRPRGEVMGSAVICHAHPRHGGSKDHPILWAIRNALARRGFAVLAFNFRGTMGSAGTYAGGRGETKDVDAAIGRVRQEADGPTLVCGWSFGAAVALGEALGDERVSALALIAPPLDPADIDVPPIPAAAELRSFRKPMLLLAGEGDVYCPRPRLESLGRSLPNAEVVILAGTDHFLWRREDEAAEAVSAFADRVFGFET